MTTSQDPRDYVHRAAGNRIGKISQMFLDGRTGQPQRVPVETGLFGTRHKQQPRDFPPDLFRRRTR